MNFLLHLRFAGATFVFGTSLLLCQSLEAQTEAEEDEGGLYVNLAWFDQEGDESAQDAALNAIGGLGPAIQGGSPATDGERLYVNPAWFAQESEESAVEAESQSDSTSPSLSSSSGHSLSEQFLQQGELSPDLVEHVWQLMDRNSDGLASDRDTYRAIRPARAFANEIEEEGADVDEHAHLRREALARFDADASGQLESGEAAYMLALVRGLRCPYAEHAEAFWASLDTNGNEQLEPAEFGRKLEPLGDVGSAMAVPLSELLHDIDVDQDDQISRAEAYFKANAMLRIQLATDGAAGHDPAAWMRFVSIIAAMDRDCDNGVVPAEAARAGMSGGQFAQIDSNGDQRITPGEMCDLQDRFDAEARAAMDAYRAAVTRARGGGGGSTTFT